MSEHQPGFIAHPFNRIDETEMKSRAAAFQKLMASRRTIRDFSDELVPQEVIDHALMTAGSAPSGANRQPWHFAVVTSAAVKKEIREGAEQEEREFYEQRAPQDWLDALAPLGTDSNKPFLEIAPVLIVVFAQKYEKDEQGNKQKNYYVTESASLATGLLIASLHNAGLATLTHTPSPMKFLNQILHRPESEKPLMVVVTGYPAADAKVPNIGRKSLNEIASFL